ncbi:MAG: hypothetical protein SPI30_09795 [Prevotella sp.]|nr:hypothetical protein [Prevotella sp.]
MSVEDDTKHWYRCYQCLVLSLPTVGTARTRHWYDDEPFPILFLQNTSWKFNLWFL